MNTTTDLQVEGCRNRQRRLLDVMRAGDIPLAIVTQNEHVQWLSGARFRDALSAAAMLTAEGRLTLFAPSKEPPFAVADEVVVFEAKSLSTIRNDQAAQYSAAVLEHLRADSPSRIGCEYSSFPQHLAASVDVELIDVEPQLFKLRRRKERDELHLLRRAIEATGAMYGRAREIVAPGVSELTVFNELQAVAVEVLGEPLTATGNDYACAARGGPPRDRRAEAGELYILDLGPAYRGYFADNCRTLAVGQEPTTLQQQAWEQCTRVFPLVESSVRPGASCRELFERAKAILDESLPWKFNHHLGHGIGLAPHEAPHPNPFWDEQFAEGDVVAIEPGLYHEELRAGIRLENDYLVTADGVELLSDFPLEL